MSHKIELTVDSCEWVSSGCHCSPTNFSSFNIISVFETVGGVYILEVDEKISSGNKEPKQQSATPNNTERVVICSNLYCDYCVEKENVTCNEHEDGCTFKGRKLTPIS